MRPEVSIRFEFVEHIPEELKEQTLYISKTYGTAVHKCLCGCGREVVTPLSPTGWQLILDGDSVSLYPSIGSWSLPCQSHYFITKNKAIWAPRWSKKQIAAGRAREANAREQYFKDDQSPALPVITPRAPTANEKPQGSLWQKIKKWFRPA